MNRHERRKARTARDPQRASYEACANATLALLRAWLEQSGGVRPRFRFPSRDIAFLGSIKDIGHRLALNDAAHDLVKLWCGLKNSAPMLNDYPTVMMVRIALDMSGVEWDTCGFADLGLAPVGGGGGWQ